MKNQQTIVKPEIAYLSEILERIEKGELLVPKFQRPFVWKPDAILSLFDSIYNSYPIGSLLFWTTDGRFQTLDKIGPHTVEKNENMPVSYILDGHQRLSTLYGGLKSSSDKNILEEDREDWQWFIYFDLKEEKFFHLKPNQKTPPNYFPLRKILKTVDFLNQTRKIVEAFPKEEEATRYIEKAEYLVSVFSKYKIAITEIKGGDLGQAVNIFARLNSEGQKMSTDMMYSALTYTEGGFNFSERITEIKEKLYEYNFGDIDRMLIFRSVLAAAGKDIYIKIKGKSNIDLLKEIIDKQELPSIVDDCEQSILKAVQFFYERINIPSQRFLPYYLQFIVFSEFFRLCPAPSEYKLKTMEQWFWVSSFTGIETINNSQKNQTLQEVQKFAKLSEEDALKFEFNAVNFSEPAIPLPDSFNLNSARVQAFILFLVSCNPSSIFSKEAIDTKEVLSEYNNKVFAPILKDKKWSWHIANRIIIEEPKYRSKVLSALENYQDSDAQQEIKTLYSHNILHSHIRNYLKNKDYESFLEARADFLVQKEEEFMKSKEVVPPSKSIIIIN